MYEYIKYILLQHFDCIGPGNKLLWHLYLRRTLVLQQITGLLAAGLIKIQHIGQVISAFVTSMP